ncbi:MAG: Smr/MutS family protein [Symbiobacteriaceae bacterium]|nr:Smr/MutS family protein [Symbiobacteriaceae bacterium]
MIVTRSGFTLTVDIHGMKEGDAKKELERLLSSAAKDITEIVVIHGYSGGQVLKNMVRQKLSHPRIKQKVLSLNHGETSLLLH